PLGPRWRVKALTEIEQFNDEIGSHFTDEGVDTIGGLVAGNLVRMQRKGETFVLAGLRFEVMSADASEVHVLLVEKLPQQVVVQDEDNL
ncbi:MAG: magnesium/cobalt efflux protein, partial [Burkholderia sp.]|nr:magnesium/cobalt efflux protein [Burkholderia sp.]